MTSNWQSTLNGNLIQLRPLAPEDWEALYACASDPKIWEQHPAHDRYEHDVFKKFFSEALESKGAFAILDLKNGNIIGSSRYYNYLPEQKRVTIGYTFLARSYWGGKFNRELKKLMLEYAFRTVDTVHFEIGVNNYRSRRAIEKIGAQLIEHKNLDTNAHVIYRLEKFYSGVCVG